MTSSDTPRNDAETPAEGTRYDPQTVEPKWIEVWAAEVNTADARSPAARAGKTFTVMIPPPNVTGSLHMGHALNNTLQDVLVRFHRMHGYETLWVPGTDHAGIATQAVVEKKLYLERKLKREEMGREAFLAEVWAWKQQYGDRILFQLRRMGASVDWTRTKFTMDEDLSAAVREAFVRLFEKGLVYRGAYLVNWDCVLRTAVSDDEIEYVAQKGKLWRIRYPVKGEPGRFVTVATTRPETMLADTGVAVHPEDERWKDLVGRTLVLPLVGREIPVVGDETVERGFGTGAVKTTPGHDPADYERGKRFNLPVLSMLNKDGTVNELGGRFAGLTREKARAAIVEALEAEGLLDGVTDVEHNVAVSDRSKSSIEPLISEQWFVRMQPLAVPAIDAVKSGRLRIVPERWTKVYLDWLGSVRDWCISRQLWWGHRIPVWYDEDGVPAASRTDLAAGAPHPVTGKPVVRQDEDVLDTWASSWLWPFATLGWPKRTEDLETFYPTQFLSTARDIIYLWVARMVMAGHEFLDHLPPEKRNPFATCYIHATVLDAQGRRMSKSLGNGIDPIDVIEQYGADAMRFTLVYLTTEGQDVKLDPKRFEMGRNFVNKVWNAARFVQTKALAGWSPSASEPELRLEDRWIRAEFAKTHETVTRAIREHRFNVAAETIYAFTWDTFCDWYLELAKPRLEPGAQDESVRGTLLHVLCGIVKLLHPVAPHVTEEVWAALRPWHGDPSHLAKAAWGEETFRDDEACASIGAVQSVVRAVRNLRKESGVSDKARVDVRVIPNGAASASLVEPLSNLEPQVLRLALASSLKVGRDLAPPASNASQVLPFADVCIDLEGKIDVAAERARLDKELAKAEQSAAASRAKLSAESFVSRAKPEVVQAERDRLAETEQRLERLRKLRAQLTPSAPASSASGG
ncbi:MAG: Valine--tRNA ligase [Planctomycetes bacterium]|nr:Valine--tRNA ligase [Planctomycetota bacterium]